MNTSTLPQTEPTDSDSTGPHPTDPVSLSASRRCELRAASHLLNPVVSISQKGLSESVLKEIDRCLTAHGLIKIRVFEADRMQRDAWLTEICTVLGAAPIQHIGKLLIIWRQKDETMDKTTVPAPRAHRSIRRLTKKSAADKSDKARSRTSQK